MADIKTGGPAFPEITGFHQRQHAKEKQRLGYDAQSEGGMTLRDYFAAHVSGLSEHTAPNYLEALTGRDNPNRAGFPIEFLEEQKWRAEAEAKYRYMVADAMIAAKGEGE